MGTRSDFYVGRGDKAEWLGSIGWGGYEIDELIYEAKTEDEYCKVVDAFLQTREDATFPRDGWPWPWEDSNITDIAYAFDGGQVWINNFGHGWYTKAQREEWDKTYAAWEEGDDWNKKKPDPPWETGGKSEFPNMKDVQNVTMGKRSGLVVISIPKEDRND